VLPTSDVGDPIERILAFLAQFVAFEDAERQLIRRITRIERYRKGTILLAEGDVARENWLVVEGCVRVYAGDRTVAFHTEFHPAIPSTYGTDAPSLVGFECLEDVVASVSTPDEEARAFAEHPALESVCRTMGEVLMARLQQSHIETVTRSPEQRYLDLAARRPDLLQRVPQYQIASLLGIQPETLSRIRFLFEPWVNADGRGDTNSRAADSST
jgi:CRP-like cAMP-binding protein